MNLKCELDSSNSDESFEMSDYKMVSSKQQSTVKYSNSKSASSDESLTDMIKKRRQQINKNVYGKEDKIELADATFDLSETYNESNKLKNLNDSTLESRIKKLELELNTSLKSTQQRNLQHNQSASMTSVDSFSIDYKQQFQQQDPRVTHYNNRLESIRSKNTEPAIEWKKGHKIEEFDFEISNLQQELQSLKDTIFKEEKEQQKQKIKLKQRLRKTTNSDSDEKESEKKDYICDLPLQKNPSQLTQVKTSSKKPSQHSEGKTNQQDFKKKSKTEVEFLDQEHSIEEKENKKHKKQVSILEDADESDGSSKERLQIKEISKSHASKKEDELKFIPVSAIEFNQKDDVSIDVVPQKQVSKTSGRILTENQQPNTLLLPSKTSLQCDVSRLYKLNKEVEVLQQIEKIRNKLKKSINKKLNTEKIIEQHDPSYTMQSKSKILNKSGKSHCPNCTYLLNKGLSSAICHCNK